MNNQNMFLTEHEICNLASQNGTPLFILDCNQLRRQYNLLQEALPKVDLFFAIKSFPNLDIVRTINDCGGFFDIASIGEIELIKQLKVSARRTIHTHPIKKDNDITAALRFGCTSFVVDNLEEIKKFIPYRSRVGLLLRVSFRSKDCAVDLSKKFGCTVEEVFSTIEESHKLGIHIKGLSFHVGSQSATPQAHLDAISACHEIILRHSEIYGEPMALLDIGGGFPVNYDGTTPNIDKFCAPIVDALAKLPDYVHVIAEPGRFLVAPAAMTISSIVGKSIRDNKTWYYMDDGVYNSFSGQIFDHAKYPLTFLKQGELTACVLAGPTCDSIDVISEDLLMPNLEIGDLVIGTMMGAYTAATATTFNSLPKAKMIVLNATK